MKAVIIGAGIGGLCAALSLHEIGIEADVYEAANQLRPLGVGINLLPHATRELDALGVLPRLRAEGIAPRRLVYCTKRGEEIWHEPRGVDAGYPWPQISIHRGLLQQILLDTVIERLGPNRIHVGRRLIRAEQNGDQAVAVFDDGHESGDLLIAADGIHSSVRKQHYPDEGPPLWNGSLLWRGVATVERLLDGRTQVWAGHPKQKFVAYPIRDQPDGRQVVNFIAELHRPESGLGRSEDWNRAGRTADFLPSFTAWQFPWLDIPATITAARSTFLFPMVDRDPLPRWTFGRTTLLGDAAHPMYPIGSNGASQAILDARVLAGCLSRYEEIDEALKHYEQVRRPATAQVIEANRSLGPELPMRLVEERAPGGFRNIEDVITAEEIAAATEQYRQAAGFALASFQNGDSVINDITT